MKTYLIYGAIIVGFAMLGVATAGYVAKKNGAAA